jgi:hypothetical protein
MMQHKKRLPFVAPMMHFYRHLQPQQVKQTAKYNAAGLVTRSKFMTRQKWQRLDLNQRPRAYRPLADYDQ